MTTSHQRLLTTSIAVFLFCLVCAAAIFPLAAFAQTEEDLQATVEETAQTYNDATTRVESIEKLIADNTARIAELEKTLPQQQSRCADAIETLYLLNSNRSDFLELILDCDSFSSFIKTLEYVDHIQRSSLAILEKTRDLKEELEQTQISLVEDKKRAEQEKVKAAAALEEAQAAREAAAQAALAQAAAQAAAAQAEQQSAAQESAQISGIPAPEVEPVPSVESGEVNWSTDKTAFVNEWAGRIDSYLAGSPLAGQGTTFASAAWDYGVDPRWSPAISNTESSKGRNCFRPYNAWGWGNKSWSSWDEAIDAHVGGLSRGYGYTISYEAAQKYCPPNYDYWYRSTYAQMQMI